MEVCCTSLPALKSLNNAPQISCWDSGHLSPMKRGREREELHNIINTLGEMSAIAQRLRSPITSFDRIIVGCHTLYLLTSGVEGKSNQILAKGMLKVGTKNLFIRKDSGHLVEMAPLCVLDFYVHESCQRMGLGYQLFEGMLKREKKQACQLAYDRPSNKLLMFLAKHYKLYKYINQANQFVVFDDYFNNVEMEEAPKQFHHNDRTCTSAADIQMEETTGVSHNMPMKDKVLFGRRTNVELDLEPCDIMASNSNVSKLRKNVIAAALTSHATCYHRGRKNHPLAAQGNRNSQSAASFFSKHADRPGSPSAANNTLDALTRHRLNLQEQKFITRRQNNNQAQPRKRYEVLLPCINLYGQHDDINQHAAKDHGLCYPSQPNMLKTNNKQADKCNTFGNHKHKSQHGGTRQMESGSNNLCHSCISKAPPLTYPFWTEAKELSGSHVHDHVAVDYSKTRSCYQDRLLTHNPVTSTWIL